MGAMPLDMARKFGPHREVEGEIGAVMLDKTFDDNFALSQGSSMLIARTNTITSEDEDGSNGTKVEAFRAAEPTRGVRELNPEEQPEEQAQCAPESQHSVTLRRNPQGSALDKQDEEKTTAMMTRFDDMDAQFKTMGDAMAARFDAGFGAIEARCMERLDSLEHAILVIGHSGGVDTPPAT